MNEPKQHPDSADLTAYGLGQLPPDKAKSIEEHINECETCCEAVADQLADDTFVDLLQGARTAPMAETSDRDDSQEGFDSSCDKVPEPLIDHPRYEIVGLIGRGGMGTVYEARHRMMQRTVALKIIKPSLMRKPDAVGRFHREMTTAAKLSHPNIVTSYDAEQAGDVHFLVMEYVDGIDLSQVVKDRGALPISEACDYIRQAALGLQHAHDCGMVHRDIKPHNVIVTSEGIVKILDFGLASIATETLSVDDSTETRSDLTAVGSVMGTPDFISPEQADDFRGADLRSDIYSLGATLYFLLSGRAPFNTGSVTEKLESHAKLVAEPLETIRDDIPAGLATIVRKIMAKDPTERFQTSAEVAEALAAYSSDTRNAPRESTQEPVSPKTSRRLFSRSAAAAVLVIVAILAAGVFFITTGNSTALVEVLDESLSVRFGDQTIHMADGKRELTIGPGEKVLIVRHDDSGFEMVTDSFTIERNDEVVFKINLLDGNVVVHKDGQPFGSREVALSRNALASMPSLAGLTPTLSGLAPTRIDLAGAIEVLGFEGPVTPQSMLEALDEGFFAHRFDEEGSESMKPMSRGGTIDLRPSVRDFSGKPTLFSPVIDILTHVVRSADPAEQTTLDTLDDRFIELGRQDTGPYRIEAKVARALLAFERGDTETASRLLEQLPGSRENVSGHIYYEPSDLSLWLAARVALKSEETVAAGKALAEFAVQAVDSYDDPGLKQALLRERGELLKEDRQARARTAAIAGDLKKAKELLKTVPGVGSSQPAFMRSHPSSDSDAAVAFKLAELLEEIGSLPAAADSYLDAFRLDPNLLSYSDIEFFQSLQRGAELGDLLTESRLKELSSYTLVPIRLFEELAKDEMTRASSYDLLKRLWLARRFFYGERGDLLEDMPLEYWSGVPDPMFYLRSLLLPEEIGQEGSGWEFFSRGQILHIEPLLQDKKIVREFADEVRAAMEEHPRWNAGVATLGFLEADLGNYEQSAKLFEQVLETAKIRPISYELAETLGGALQGRDRRLDDFVIRLFELSLANYPYDELLRESPLPDLAQFYADYGRKAEARQLLLRLGENQSNYCGAGFREHSGMSCVLCHRQEQSVTDYTLMSERLTDFGFPVDAVMSLARIDASFHNVLSGDPEWSKRILPELEPKNYQSDKEDFLAAKGKTEAAVTPESVIGALKVGVLASSKGFADGSGESNAPIDLRLSVGGAGGQSTVFSPVIDILKLAVKGKAGGSPEAIAELDEELARLSEANPDDLPTLVAATVFAFLRNDLPTAEERLKTLQDLESTTDGKPNEHDAALWLVARHAVQNETTRSSSPFFMERALAAAETQPESGFKEAFLRERPGILQQ